MLVLNLTKNVSATRINVRSRVEAKDGVRRVKAFDKLVPGSLHIPHGKMIEADEAVLGCPDVMNAIAKRWIRVHREAPSVAKPVAKPSAAAVSSEDEVKPKRRGQK